MQRWCTLLGILFWAYASSLYATKESTYNADAVRELVLGYEQFVKGNYSEAAEGISKAISYDKNSAFLKVVYAEMLYSTSRHQEVLEVLKPLVKREDSLGAEVYKMLGLSSQEVGSDKEAITYFKHVLKQDPEDKWVRRRLLELLNKESRFQEMIPTYKPLLDPEEPTYAQDLFRLGAIYLRIGGLEPAGEYLEQAVEVDSTMADAHLFLGNIRQQEGNWPQALKYYLAYLKLSPDALEGFFDRVLLVAMRAGDFESPINLLEAVLVAQDSSDLAREQLGTLYYHADRFEKALGLMEQPARRETLSANGYYTLGFLYSRLQRPSDALDAFNRVKLTQPDFTPVYLILGKIHLMQKDLKRAESVLMEGLGRVTEDDKEKRRDLMFSLVNVYQGLGDSSKIESYLKTIIKKNPDFAPALNYLGYYYAERGIKLKEARRLIDRALKIDPGNGHFIDSLGWVLFRMGRTEEALKQIKASLEIVGAHEEVYEHLGDIYRAMGEDEKARDAWSKSLELYGENQDLKKKLDSLGNTKDSVESDK
jgi:tetratricopeptide (TPR) repeat protein